MSEDNISSALEAGKLLSGLSPRFMLVQHPDDSTIKIPVALSDGDNGSRVEVASDVLEAFDERMIGPRRRSGIVYLTDADSFVGFVQRWGSDATVIYADTKSLGFTAVIDENPAGPSGTAWRGHRAVYACPRSPEWQAWTAVEGKAMSQTDFADFIESRLEDLAVVEGLPKPLDVLQVARQLNIKTKGTFQREINPTNGDHILVSKTETTSDSTQIPRAFGLAIPVFESGTRYQVEARVRFALVDGRPQFSFTMHRRKEIERDAFGEVRNVIATETKRVILAGTA